MGIVERRRRKRGVGVDEMGIFLVSESIFIGCLSHIVDMNDHKFSKQGEICEKIVIKSTPKFSQTCKVKNMM